MLRFILWLLQLSWRYLFSKCCLKCARCQQFSWWMAALPPLRWLVLLLPRCFTAEDKTAPENLSADSCFPSLVNGPGFPQVPPSWSGAGFVWRDPCETAELVQEGWIWSSVGCACVFGVLSVLGKALSKGFSRKNISCIAWSYPVAPLQELECTWILDAWNQESDFCLNSPRYL